LRTIEECSPSSFAMYHQQHRPANTSAEAPPQKRRRVDVQAAASAAARTTTAIATGTSAMEARFSHLPFEKEVALALVTLLNSPLTADCGGAASPAASGDEGGATSGGDTALCRAPSSRAASPPAAAAHQRPNRGKAKFSRKNDTSPSPSTSRPRTPEKEATDAGAKPVTPASRKTSRAAASASASAAEKQEQEDQRAHPEYTDEVLEMGTKDRNYYAKTHSLGQEAKKLLVKMSRRHKQRMALRKFRTRQSSPSVSEEDEDQASYNHHYHQSWSRSTSPTSSITSKGSSEGGDAVVPRQHLSSLLARFLPTSDSAKVQVPIAV